MGSTRIDWNGPSLGEATEYVLSYTSSITCPRCVASYISEFIREVVMAEAIASLACCAAMRHLPHSLFDLSFTFQRRICMVQPGWRQTGRSHRRAGNGGRKYIFYTKPVIAIFVPSQGSHSSGFRILPTSQGGFCSIRRAGNRRGGRFPCFTTPQR